jgi:NAD(P)-dependent dehydrogenase (short-subunit alcohol dehydrogenase family)
MRALEGKVAIITGASGGIGDALVTAFLENGARVLAADVVPTPSTQAEHSRFVRADVSREEDVQNLVARALESFGALDILVNNAAVLTPAASVEKTSPAQFDRLVAVNLRGAFLMCKHAFTHLQKSRGCILNVSSMAGVHGEKEHAVYAATKGALNALTQSMAIDWGADGIRVNALCPSSVLTPNVDAMIEQLPNAPEVIELRKNINALGWTATPPQIAAVAVFLCSPQAAFMTGAIVPVSGGSECGYGVKY